jgi:hypothetical protein
MTAERAELATWLPTQALCLPLHLPLCLWLSAGAGLGAEKPQTKHQTKWETKWWKGPTCPWAIFPRRRLSF